MNDLVRNAAGGQNMRRLKRRRVTGASRGCADSSSVEHEQDGFALDIFEYDIDVIGQALCRMTVQTRLGYRQKTVDKAFSEHVKPLRGRIHLLYRELECKSDTHNARDILRARTPLSLLIAAVHERIELDSLSDIENTRSLGSVELVSRD